MQETQTQYEVPAEINFTDADVKRAGSRPQLRVGIWAKFTVRGPATKSISSGQKNPGSYVLSLNCAPTDAEGEPRSPTIRHNLYLPIVNPQVEGHFAPDTLGLCHQYLLAIGAKGITRYPRYDRNANGWVNQATGEVITKEQAETIKTGLDRAVMTEMKRRWADPDAFANDQFFAKVILDKKQQKYRNLDGITAEVPAGEELTTDSFVDTDAE
jgi:hypothetical protein